MATVVDGGPVVPHAQAFADRIADQFGVSHIMTYDGHQPTKPRALDIFVSRAQGDAISQLAIDNIDFYGIDYIIWWQRIYNPEVKLSWRLMADRHSITQNHIDHVHISFEPTGNAKPGVIPTRPVPLREDQLFSKSPGPTFHIIASHSGLMVEYSGEAPIDNGRPVVCSAATGGLDQRWEIVTHKDGTVTFVSRANNKAIDVPGNDPKPGGNVKAHDANWTAAQRFHIVQIAPHLGKIVHAGSGLVLDVTGGEAGMESGRPVILWKDNGGRNQQFIFAPTV